MAKVRIEVVTFEPGAQMVTGGVIQSQTLELKNPKAMGFMEGEDRAQSEPVGSINLGDAEKTTGVYGNVLSGDFIAYIRVTEGSIAWRKDSKYPDLADPAIPANPNAMPPIPEDIPADIVDDVACIIRTENHDAIPVKVYRNDVFSFLWISD